MTPLCVVLDTNVVISGLLFGGHPGTILEYAFERLIDVATSPDLSAEIERVLLRKFPYAKRAVEETLILFKRVAIMTHPREAIDAIREDPSDNHVLACAVSAKADAIVSGDKHLLALGAFRRIPIVSPTDFLDRWRAKHR